MKVSDLDFKRHQVDPSGTKAEATFNNGYGASVITGDYFYTSDKCPYEVAVLYEGSLVYDTPITDDVLGYLTEEEANQALKDIEALPERDGEPSC